MYFLNRVQNIQIFSLKQISRYIFTNCTMYNMKQNKLNKLINKNRSRDPLELITKPLENVKKPLSMHTVRRMKVLNKVFMEHITDIMSTGELEPEILNRDIEISHVKITSDFKLINVFWINNDEEISDTEKLLKSCAPKLRYELCQLYIMGNVPTIQFVKCKGIEMVKEVHKRLESLGYGKHSNLYPNTTYHVITEDRTVNDKKIQDKKSSNDSKDVFSVSLPLMMHNVFGLDHYKVMSKIKLSIGKSKNAHNKQVNASLLSSISPNQTVENVLTTEEEQQTFAKFLKAKQKQQKQKCKTKYYTANELSFDSEQEEDEDNYDFEYDENDYDFDNDNYDDEKPY